MIPRYPLASGETFEFTPDSLLKNKPKPVFKFRWPSRNDARVLRMACAAAEPPLEFYGDRQIRTETMRAIDELFEGGEAEERKHRLLGLWDAIDAFGKEEETKTYKEGDERAQFNHPDLGYIENMLTDINARWPRLRIMAQSSSDFINEVPRMWFQLLCLGWSGLKTEYERTGDMLNDDLVEDLIEELDEIEPNGIAWLELAGQASRLRALSREKRKNSSSPAPSTPTPETSKMATEPQAGTNGSSPDSTEASPATPAT